MNKLIGLSGTAPLSGLHFLSANIQETLSESSSCTLTLQSDSAALQADDFLAKNLCLSFETRDSTKRFFDGVVVEMEQLSMASNGRCAYRLELRSWTWLLGRNQEFRVYQNMTVTDIVAEVIGRHSHPSVRFSDRTRSAGKVREYVVQFGESDLNFISRIMEQEGVYFFFEHAENQHTLVLADSLAVHTAYPGYEQLNYDPALQGNRLLAEEMITAMSLRQSIEAGRHSHSDYNFKTPSTSLLAGSESASQPFDTAHEVFEYPGEYDSGAEGAHYSQLRNEEARVQHQTFSAQTNARGVAAACLLLTVCKDNPSLSKSLLVTHTSIHIQESEPEAQGGFQSDFTCHFHAVDASRTYRPARKSRKPHAPGPLPALVVGPQGREIHTDEFGRIKIQFYWDRYGQRNENSSCWVRVATPAAGKGWGFIAIPRIGQEVIVSFEAGDPDRPLVIGLAYNAEQKVPYRLPEQKTVSGWRTQSTENGTPSNFNELRFDDRIGSEYVWFQAEKDYLSLIKNNSSIEIGGNSSKLVHGSLVEEIKADVSRTVLGQVSQQIEKALHLTVNDDLLAKVQGLLGLISNGQIAISTTGQFSLKSDSSTDLHSVGNLNLHSSSQGNFKAGSSLRFTAESSLSLNVGASSICITSSGIELSGPSISLNGNGGVAAAASARTVPPETAVEPQPVEPPVDPIS